MILATLMTISSTAPSFAVVQSYITEKGGVKYEYNVAHLRAAALANVLEAGSSALWNKYMGETLIALRDSVNGPISAAAVRAALTDSIIFGTTFDVNTYTESATAKAHIADVTGAKPVNQDGTVESSSEFEVISIE